MAPADKGEREKRVLEEKESHCGGIGRSVGGGRITVSGFT